MKPSCTIILLLIVVIFSVSCGPWGVETKQHKPNILFILTDDQEPDSLQHMEALQEHLVDQGTSFKNSFVTTPQCCPSRATFLRGQYAHNHGVLENSPPSGGFEKFHETGMERSTIATWLREASYETAYVGRYLNGGYGQESATRYVPPGWDEWRVRLGGHIRRTYSANENGEIKTYDRQDFSVDTDYFSHEAEEFVRGYEDNDTPWFLVVGTSAPHQPSFAAKRHKEMFKDAQMPKPPSFNEEDVSDKPESVRKRPQLNEEEVAKAEEEWRQRQRSLQTVDDLVDSLVVALDETKQLEETYIVYTSDNGYLLYRHREHTKGAPYEESIGVPLIVRGPGVPRGTVREQLVSNTDWAPTIAEWAGTQPADFVDGRSFASLLSQNPPRDWRKRLLIEFFLQRKNEGFRGLRTSHGKTYVEYGNGEQELYDIDEDPYQLDSIHDSVEQSLLTGLHDRLETLEDCSGEECRTAENKSP
jgi:N-acetylglucosamine-6-sulfatase